MTVAPDSPALKGAEWLDKVHPTWWREVDLVSLDLEDSCYCVLGQIVGKVNTDYNYFDLLFHQTMLPDLPQELILTEAQAIEMGFDADKINSFSTLTKAWREIILDRYQTWLKDNDPHVFYAIMKDET